MADKYFTLTIPTRPFIKKYLETRHGAQLMFGTNDIIGIIIASVVQKKVFTDRSRTIVYNACIKLSCSMKIHLPAWWLYKYGISLDDKNILFLNTVFNEFFERDLYLYCLQLTCQGIDRKIALEKFCDEHNIVIDEDISYEGIKKIEYRYRKKIDEKDRRKLSPDKNPQLTLL